MPRLGSASPRLGLTARARYLTYPTHRTYLALVSLSSAQPTLYFFVGLALFGTGAATFTPALKLLNTVSTNMSGEYAPAFFA